MLRIWTIAPETFAPAERPTREIGRSFKALLGDRCDVQEIVLKMPPAERFPNGTVIAWDHKLSEQELLGLPCKAGKITADWPDIVVTAHQIEGGPIGLGIVEASGGRTRAVQVQSPNAEGAPQYDLKQFAVVFSQPHEHQSKFEGAGNVVSVPAIHDLNPETKARHRAEADARTPAMVHPILNVNLGGNDEQVRWTQDEWRQLGRFVAAQSSRFAEVYVTSMGKTAPDLLAAFAGEVSAAPNVSINDKRFGYNHILSSLDPALGDAGAFTADGSLLGRELLDTGVPVTVFPPANFDEISVARNEWKPNVEAGRLGIVPEFSERPEIMTRNSADLIRHILVRTGRAEELACLPPPQG